MTDNSLTEMLKMQSGMMGQLMSQLAAKSSTTPHPEMDGPVICVADRGHVWIAPTMTINGEWLKLDNARIVRRWGTDRGLNQLAAHGPRSETTIDEKSDVLIHMRAVIAIIPCNPTKWKGKLDTCLPQP